MDRKAFHRIFIIMFENELQSVVMENDYMRSLAGRGVNLANYWGVTHPSQPNYIASIAGLPLVVDDLPKNVPQTNLVDLLEAAGISWKAYMEVLPDGSSAGQDKTIQISSNGLYWRKHNPFISFDNIQTSPARLARVVNAMALEEDIAADNLPEYCWYTPNIQNDGHSPQGLKATTPRSTPSSSCQTTCADSWSRC